VELKKYRQGKGEAKVVNEKKMEGAREYRGVEKRSKLSRESRYRKKRKKQLVTGTNDKPHSLEAV